MFTTRVSDSGFADGDAIGVYVVDYDGEVPGTPLSHGNRADNLRFTFDEGGNKWLPDHDIYWKDNTTKIDVYGYYPRSADYPESLEAWPFEIREDQDAEGAPGGYEASDLLWGKVTGAAPTDRMISLQLHHVLSGVRVTLAEGSGFDSSEWALAEKNVIIPAATRQAQVNLTTGAVSAVGGKPEHATRAVRRGQEWRCILVPQTLPSGETLFVITVGGISYSVRRSEDFTFSPSRLHNFSYTVNKRADTGGLEFVLVSESVTAWENDSVSHDATAREYIIIQVDEPGTLEARIRASGKDLTRVRNLKVTGEIDARDFETMRDKLTDLRALNLREARIMGYEDQKADEIPATAMSGKTSLESLVLPDRLRKIHGTSGSGTGAFSGCTNLTGSLIIPEGVTEIGPAAFYGDGALTGTLSLPSTLERIGNVEGYIGYYDGTFYGCGFTCELKLPEKLKVIGMGAFGECRGFFGELRLPESLEEIGPMAFAGCSGLEGSLEIPQKVTDIPADCFSETHLGGVLTLHDGIATIGTNAFSGAGLRGELRLPSSLETIGNDVFANCDFSGELHLPEGLLQIGNAAFFGNWRLRGVLEFPRNLTMIGESAFAYCRSLEGLVFPEGLESIKSNAFLECYGIGSITCKGTIPPVIRSNPFDGVPKDNFTLEVPETAIAQYQAASGWRDFKRIAAYRNFVVRPSVATAINTSVTRDLVLTSDEAWLVESKPSWVSLDRESGEGKCELRLTFSSMPRGGASSREGEVVFKMRDRDYRTRCKVTQYDYAHGEDEVITLQSASRGRGINIVLLGDGFNAKDIQDGKLLDAATEAAEHFFGLEPYRSYRDYFNVYTAISVSPESGIGSVNTIVYNRFNTSAKGGVTLGGRNDSDFDVIRDYACKAPTVDAGNLGESLIIMLPNTSDYGGICYWFPDGLSIAYCPMSNYGYPLDFRGVVQHEAGGHGFGHLGDEYIYHNAFIDACSCSCCSHELYLDGDHNINLSLTGKMSEVAWSHLIFHEKYSGMVDIFEGGYMHSRGVFRSEQNSCMNNDIPYYSTISREHMVRRIKQLAGETFSFEEFVEKDIVEAGTATRSSLQMIPDYVPMGLKHAAPVWVGQNEEGRK